MNTAIESIQGGFAGNYAAEFLFFLFKIGDALLEPTLRIFIYEAACLNEYPSDGVCDNLQQDPNKELIVQSYASRYTMLYKILLNFPAMLMVLFCGAWSDKGGRKLPVLLTCMGTCLAVLIYTIAGGMFGHVPNIPLILIGAGVRGIFGRSAVMTMAAHSYVSDNTRANQRTVRLSGLVATSHFGYLVGSIAAGIGLERLGFNAIFMTVMSIHAIVVLVAYWCMRDETPGGSTTPPNVKTAETNNRITSNSFTDSRSPLRNAAGQRSQIGRTIDQAEKTISRNGNKDTISPRSISFSPAGRRTSVTMDDRQTPNCLSNFSLKCDERTPLLASTKSMERKQSQSSEQKHNNIDSSRENLISVETSRIVTGEASESSVGSIHEVGVVKSADNHENSIHDDGVRAASSTDDDDSELDDDIEADDELSSTDDKMPLIIAIDDDESSIIPSNPRVNTTTTDSVVVSDNDCFHRFKSFCVCLRPRCGVSPYILFLIFLILFVQQGNKSGETDVMLLFTRRSPINLSKAGYGYLLATLYASLGFFAFMGPRFLKKVNISLSDTAIALVGTAFKITGLAIASLSKNAWLLFLAYALSGPHSLTISCNKSMISKLCNEKDLGKAFSLISSGETLANLLGSVIYTTIYSSTLSVYPCVMFVVEMGMYIVIFFTLVHIYVVLKRLDNTTENVEQGNSTPNKNTYESLDDDIRRHKAVTIYVSP